jgi:molecular chaperone GrpE
VGLSESRRFTHTAADLPDHPLDPRLHEAVGSQESNEHPEGTVVEELRRGYRIGDRVLRPSLVKLARGPEKAGAGQAQDS